VSVNGYVVVWSRIDRQTGDRWRNDEDDAASENEADGGRMVMMVVRDESISTSST
jgi:hypothetical protein